jgi:D-glycero-alpha-D-manno-heptose-7-phosphate kinase
LGSSSTLVVALVTAFVEFMNLPLGEYDIARLAFEIERVDLALEGGRQDQYAATFGGFNYMEFYAEERVVVNPLRIKEWIVSELEASLVLFYTGISRASAEIIHEQSSNVKRGNSRSVDAMFALKQDAVLMKEALLKGDFKGMARAMRDSWENKKQTAHKVSNDHIEHIYAKALEAGALGGKVSGAGGGGYMIFLVEPTRRAKVVEALAAFPGQASNVHFTKQGSQAWRVR